MRELENLIERAMIIYRDEPLRFDLGGSAPARTQPSAPEIEDDDLPLLDTVIEGHIRRALEVSNWKNHGAGGAGELLGVNPNTLRNRMKKLGIPFRNKG